MRIGIPQLRLADGRAIVEAEIEADRFPKALWYSVPERFGHMLDTSSNAQLAALLIPAMARGEAINLAAAISERLHYNLDALQSLLLEVMPFLKRSAVRAAALDGARTAAHGVATGLSGGIDSFTTLGDHHYAAASDGFRITHLLYNNVGSHDLGGEATFRRRFARLLPLTEHLGLPFIDVNSNLDSFYTGRLTFQQTHTLRNASVALLLGRGIGRFMYASTHRFRDVAVGPHYSSGPTDTISLPLLATESTDCFSVGSQYSRLEKTLRVSMLPDSYEFLDVCNRNWTPKNCGNCGKCKRTLLTLEIAGKLQAYDRVFDLAAYRKVRDRYLGRVFHDRDVYSREIAEFARSSGFPRNAYSRLYGPAWRLKESMKKRLAQVRSRI